MILTSRRGLRHARTFALFFLTSSISENNDLNLAKRIATIFSLNFESFLSIQEKNNDLNLAKRIATYCKCRKIRYGKVIRIMILTSRRGLRPEYLKGLALCWTKCQNNDLNLAKRIATGSKFGGMMDKQSQE